MIHSSMECEHNWKKIDTIEGPHGGYMMMFMCSGCFQMQGSGFLDKDHETYVLERMFE